MAVSVVNATTTNGNDPFEIAVRLTNDSWGGLDETYILVKGKQKYLYRAVDSQGNALDFLLTAKRDALAAKRFFHKTLKAVHTSTPKVITVDKNPAYPKTIQELIAAKKLPQIVKLRQSIYPTIDQSFYLRHVERTFKSNFSSFIEKVTNIFGSATEVMIYCRRE